MYVIKVIWNWLYLRYHLGSSTPIKLWSTEKIKGSIVYAIKHAEHEYTMQYYRELRVLGHEEALKNLHRRGAKVCQKYFGPKWVKAKE